MSLHENIPAPSGGLPVAPAPAAELQAEFPPPDRKAFDRRVATMTGVASQLRRASFAAVSRLTLFGTPLVGRIFSSVFGIVRRHALATDKNARCGAATPSTEMSDTLDQVLVRDAATTDLVVLHGDDTVEKVRRWLESGAPESRHQGFPVIDDRRRVLGIVTRSDLAQCERGEHALRRVLQRLPILVDDDCTVREALELMLRHDVGRLPVVRRGEEEQLVGIITRSDIPSAYMRRLHDHQRDGHPKPERPAAKPREKTTV